MFDNESNTHFQRQVFICRDVIFLKRGWDKALSKGGAVGQTHKKIE
jgi:hypothetical protein